jgi:manganese-dependent inorganic pyrophosphatase
MLLEDAAGCNMVLVDHSELVQSADGLQDAHILTIIDHHGDGSVTTGNQLIYDARPVGAAATIVWIRYRDYGIEPDQKTAMALLGAVLSDTSNLKSKNTTTADREALKALSSLAGVTDLDSFYRDLYKASISYEGKTDEEIYQSDLREYEAGGIKYMIGCVEAYDEETAEELAARMKGVIPSAMQEMGADMAYAQVSIFHDDISITYIVPSDDAAAGVIEEAFGDKAVFDGTSYVLNPGVSRRQVLVPAITDVLESHPRE